MVYTWFSEREAYRHFGGNGVKKRLALLPRPLNSFDLIYATKRFEHYANHLYIRGEIRWN